MEKIIIFRISHFFAVIFLSVLITGAISAHVMGEDASDTMEAAKRAVRMRHYSKAASLFHTLAFKGDTDAKYQLGAFFQMGRGVPKDHAKAIEWYKKAAKQGHMKAQFNLGTMYENGWGTPPDYQKAYEYYQKAAAQGHDKAKAKCMKLREGGLLMLGNTDLSNEELLIAAVKKDDLNNIVQLLNAGSDIDYQDKYGHTPLIEAVGCRHIEATKLLIAKGAYLETYNNEGDNALLLATQKGNLEIAKMLLEAGANVNAPNNHGCISLMIAAKRNDILMVQLLIDYKADVQKVDDHNRNALYFALNKGNEDVINCLLATGKVTLPSSDEENQETLEKIVTRLKMSQDAGYPDNAEESILFERWTPLMIAAWRDEIDIVQLLLCQGEEVNERSEDGHTALSRAAWKGHLDIVDVLLHAGAEINVGDANTSPHILAAKYGHKEVVLRLIQEYIDKYGEISLFGRVLNTASSQEYGEIVEIMVDAGIALKIEENKQISPSLLLAASLNGKIKLVKILLRHGADINVSDEAGRTPLMLSAKMGHKEVVGHLLQKNAEIDRKDKQGHTALSLSAHAGNFEIVALLINAGSNIQIKSKYGNTLLMLAADAGHDGIVRQLIDQGGEIDAINKSGDNALIIAMKRSEKNVAKILLDNGAIPYVSLSKLENVDTEMKELLKEYRTVKKLSAVLFKKPWGK
jgi:ankyrin repeat protein